MAHHKISQRVQLLTLCPLLLGIFICSTFVIIILYNNHNTWVSSTQSYIDSSSFTSLNTLSISTSTLLSASLKQLSFELNTLNQLFSQSIQLAQQHQSLINTINYYSITNPSQSAKANQTVWLSNNNQFTNFEFYGLNLKNRTTVVDAFLRSFYSQSRNWTQVGMIVTSDPDLPAGQILDYRYPVASMDYIKYGNSNSICGQTGTYSAACTQAYQALKSGNYQVLVYTDEGMIKVLRNSASGAFLYYLPLDFFDDLFSGVEEYGFFVSDFSGNRMIRVVEMENGQNSFQFNQSVQKVSENLFGDNEELMTQMDLGLQGSQTNLSVNGSASFEAEGFFSSYYASVSYLNIDAQGSDTESSLTEDHSMLAGVYINKGFIYQDWYTVLNDIIDTVIIQMVIFLVLLSLTCLVAWVLSVEIAERVIKPIYFIERFLERKHTSIDFGKNYNKETNKILNFLKMLHVLENMIEPRFFLHPKLEEREKNLKKSLELFEIVLNKRGKSIVLNLLGNLAYEKKDFSAASQFYRTSTLLLEELIEEVDQQEKGEKELTDKDKEKFYENLEIKEKSWEIEKNCLKEMIIDRKQQLCMGLSAEVRHSKLDFDQSRILLKEIINHQIDILLYYVSNKTHYFRLMKLLIDIARIYQDLKYYHSAIEILDISRDELKTVDLSDKLHIDIDLARLNKLGLLNDTEHIKSSSPHFDIKGFTFEKDILLQMTIYRRAKILLECDKLYEAGLAFTAVIELGEFYDPRLRKKAVRSLSSLLEKHLEPGEAASVSALKSDMYEPKSSVIFLLAYDLNLISITSKLLDFIEEKLSKSKIGAAALTAEPEKRMKPWQRDEPIKDFESFLSLAKESSLNSSVLDSIILSLNDFEDCITDTCSLIVVLTEFTTNGFAVLDDLILFNEKNINLHLLIPEGTHIEPSITKKLESINANISEFSNETLPKALNSLYKKIKIS